MYYRVIPTEASMNRWRLQAGNPWLHIINVLQVLGDFLLCRFTKYLAPRNCIIKYLALLITSFQGNSNWVVSENTISNNESHIRFNDVLFHIWDAFLSLSFSRFFLCVPPFKTLLKNRRAPKWICISVILIQSISNRMTLVVDGWESVTVGTLLTFGKSQEYTARECNQELDWFVIKYFAW